jgi:hypothetical protein
MNPVAIPSGGMIIFLAETAVRDSRTRQIITAIAPIIEVISDIIFNPGIIIKKGSSSATEQLASHGRQGFSVVGTPQTRLHSF